MLLAILKGGGRSHSIRPALTPCFSGNSVDTSSNAACTIGTLRCFSCFLPQRSDRLLRPRPILFYSRVTRRGFWRQALLYVSKTKQKKKEKERFLSAVLNRPIRVSKTLPRADKSEEPLFRRCSAGRGNVEVT